MKKCLLMLVFLTGFSLHAQDSITINKQKSVVSLSLMSPVFGYAPRWNAGYMHRLSQNWWAGADLGYGTSGAMPHFGMAYSADKGIGSRYRLFEARPEIYYDLIPATPMECMLSVEYFYIRQTDTYSDGSFRNTSDTQRTHYTTADYTRIKQGANINLSTFINFNSNLGLAIKTGLGWRTRYVNYTNVVVESIDTAEDDGHYGFGSFKDEGSTVFLNLNLDLRLFYRF